MSNKNKLMIFALLFVFIVGLGAAYASNETDRLTSDGVTTNSSDPSVPASNYDPNNKAVIIEAERNFTRVANDWHAGERGGLYYVTLKDNEGNLLSNKTVQIAVNGPLYDLVTDSEGKAALQINFASANIYTLAVTFAGDEGYNPSQIVTSKLFLTKKPVKLSASDMVFKSTAKTKSIAVTLKTSKNPYDGNTYLSPNKKLTLTVKGKVYKAYTNSKGFTKFTVKLNRPGTFDAVIRFAGDRTYDAGSKKIKITIE